MSTLHLVYDEKQHKEPRMVQTRESQYNFNREWYFPSEVSEDEEAV